MNAWRVLFKVPAVLKLVVMVENCIIEEGVRQAGGRC